MKLWLWAEQQGSCHLSSLRASHPYSFGESETKCRTKELMFLLDTLGLQEGSLVGGHRICDATRQQWGAPRWPCLDLRPAGWKHYQSPPAAVFASYTFLCSPGAHCSSLLPAGFLGGILLQDGGSKNYKHVGFFKKICHRAKHVLESQHSGNLGWKCVVYGNLSSSWDMREILTQNMKSW